jgi:SAM-dependent methyltransferase
VAAGEPEEDPQRIVAAGYDLLGTRFQEWQAAISDDPRGRVRAEFMARLPVGSRVLDLGCGAGIPSTLALSVAFDVVGVDVSERQLELARLNVPGATFIHGDFTEIEFVAESFGGVCAMYSISHVPRHLHAGLFAKVYDWLLPGGLFVASLGAVDSPDWTGTWLGVPMFFSSHDAATNRALLTETGFELVFDEVLGTKEPEGNARFLWVIAAKPDHYPPPELAGRIGASG